MARRCSAVVSSDGVASKQRKGVSRGLNHCRDSGDVKTAGIVMKSSCLSATGSLKSASRGEARLKPPLPIQDLCSRV